MPAEAVPVTILGDSRLGGLIPPTNVLVDVLPDPTIHAAIERADRLLQEDPVRLLVFAVGLHDVIANRPTPSIASPLYVDRKGRQAADEILAGIELLQCKHSRGRFAVYPIIPYSRNMPAYNGQLNGLQTQVLCRDYNVRVWTTRRATVFARNASTNLYANPDLYEPDYYNLTDAGLEELGSNFSSFLSLFRSWVTSPGILELPRMPATDRLLLHGLYDKWRCFKFEVRNIGPFSLVVHADIFDKSRLDVLPKFVVVEPKTSKELTILKRSFDGSSHPEKLVIRWMQFPYELDPDAIPNYSWFRRFRPEKTRSIDIKFCTCH